MNDQPKKTAIEIIAKYGARARNRWRDIFEVLIKQEYTVRGAAEQADDAIVAEYEHGVYGEEVKEGEGAPKVVVCEQDVIWVKNPPGTPSGTHAFTITSIHHEPNRIMITAEFVTS